MSNQSNYNRTLFKGRINNQSQEGQSLIAGLQDWKTIDRTRNQPPSPLSLALANLKR